MLRRFFAVLQFLTLLLPIVVFFTYIIAAEGDQWTSEHFLATVIFAIPLIVVLVVKWVVFGSRKT
jgi:hypothetical protein